MKRFGRSILTWVYGLLGGCLGGGASALGAKFGLDGLQAMGINVPTLSFKQMGWIFLSGVISHGVLYMMKSPIPPLTFDDDTAPPFKLPDGSNVKTQIENKTS